MRRARVLASYVAAFALLAAPWLLQATHAIPLNTIWARGDTRLLTWILWWVAHSLVNAPAGLLDAPINYPAPAQITGSEHFLGLQLLFLPVYQATGNPVLAMNALLFLSYPLAAFAMNRLLVALGFTSAVAWLVGFGFALGAIQVPANVHLLHVLAFYLPTVALALHHLRDEPGLRRGVLLALLLLIAFFTAYYTTAILLPVILIWTIAELVRPLPGRRRFAAITCAAVLGCLALLGAASGPYLSRGAVVGSSDEQQLLVRQMHAVVGTYVTLAPVEILGALSLVLGAAGCCFVYLRRWRPVVVVGIVLVATSYFLITGGPLAIVSALPPSGLTRALLLPLSFIRVVMRFITIAGFGLALLAAVALQRAHDRLPGRVTLALFALIGAGFTLERGRQMFFQPLERFPALSVEAPIYREVARVIAREGGGPLLEMPLSQDGYSFEPEAMLGGMIHRQPLIVGHTGYLPPHRPLVGAAIHRLPAEDALQDLVDMTHLRWLLVRPVRYWHGAGLRKRLVHDLERVPGVRRVAQIDGWTLLEIARAAVDPGRFDAIARRGVTPP